MATPVTAGRSLISLSQLEVAVAEHSHQSIRRREQIVKRFTSSRQLQRFVSIHDPIANLFHLPRNALSSADHRDLREMAMATRREIVHLHAA